MSVTGEELSALAGDGDETPHGAAVLQAVLRFEEAEWSLRGRLRGHLHIGKSDLTALRFLMRAEAKGHPAHPGELSRRLDVTSAATTAIVDRLALAGLVERRNDPLDRRGRILVVSDAARTDLNGVLGETQSDLRDVLRTIDVGDADRIVHLLGEMSKILDRSTLATA